MNLPEEAEEIKAALEEEMTRFQRARFYASLTFVWAAAKLYPLSMDDTVEVAKPIAMKHALDLVGGGMFGGGLPLGDAPEPPEPDVGPFTFDHGPGESNGDCGGDCGDCECDDEEEREEA